MEFILVVILALLSYFVGVAVGQDIIKDKAEKLRKDLFESYDGDSDNEKYFRNGARWMAGKLTGETQDYEDVVHQDADEITATEISTIYDLLISLGYNRSDEDMIELCKELIDRVTGDDWRYDKHKATDEGDIIYGYIIMLFDNYGASPRSGWFEDEKENLVPLIVDQIKAYMNAKKTSIEMHEGD